MGKNLFDYADEVKSEKNDLSKEEFIKSKVENYSKMSQSEMFSNLLSEVQSAKMNGTFDYNKISSSIEMIREYLTPEQQRNLENLLEKIK